MRLTLSELRSHINSLLQEYKIQPNVTLYHRSQNNYKVGDVISPGDIEGTSKFRSSKSDIEIELESYRKKNFPDLPSRLTCVYASLVPHSRFLSKGKLYVIEPIGITHTTNSRLIDRILYSRRGHSDLIEDYWYGEEPRKSNLQDMEVLMNSAKVVEVIKEDNRLKSGDKIKFESNAPILNAQIDYYPSDEKNGVPFVYVNDNKELLKDVINIMDVDGLEITNLSKIDVDKNPSNYSSTINVSLAPGFVGKISTFYYGQPGQKDEQIIQASIVVNSGPQMVLDQNETRKLVKAFRQGKIIKI
jgi:ribosomal protein S17